jgi:putative ABC transport system permease protein
MGLEYMLENPSNQLGMNVGMLGSIGIDVWQELNGSQDFLKSQYDITAGRFPEAYNEVVIITDRRNRLQDYTLYALGLRDTEEIENLLVKVMQGEELNTTATTYEFEDLLKLSYKLVPTTDYYEKVDGIWVDKRENPLFMKDIVDNAQELRVVGILKPSEDSINALTHAIGYSPDLMAQLVHTINNSAIVKEQKANEDIDVFTGLEFGEAQEFDMSTLSPEEMTAFAQMSPEELEAMKAMYGGGNTGTYESNLAELGVSELDSPQTIAVYPKDFNAKDEFIALIDEYNERQEQEGKEENVIKYVDFVGLLMSSISSVINNITYILIAFVAVSLVVSSIMVSILVYISVLERIKEIGILRSVGASKNDITRVFLAESAILGFLSGTLGIVVTMLLLIPANYIIKTVSDVSGLAVLPIEGALGLILLSTALTLIAGLVPSKIAARKDPVEALRSE